MTTIPDVDCTHLFMVFVLGPFWTFGHWTYSNSAMRKLNCVDKAALIWAMTCLTTPSACSLFVPYTTCLLMPVLPSPALSSLMYKSCPVLLCQVLHVLPGPPGSNSTWPCYPCIFTSDLPRWQCHPQSYTTLPFNLFTSNSFHFALDSTYGRCHEDRVYTWDIF